MSSPDISHLRSLPILLAYVTFSCITNLHSAVFFKCYSSQTLHGKSLCFTMNFSQKFTLKYTIYIPILIFSALRSQIRGRSEALMPLMHGAREAKPGPEGLKVMKSKREDSRSQTASRASSHSQANSFPSLLLHCVWAFPPAPVGSGPLTTPGLVLSHSNRPFSNKFLKLLI